MAEKPLRSRRKKPEGIVTSTGVTLTESHCRKCMKMRPVSKFFSATDPVLDSNGLFSICKDCVNSLFVQFYLVERSKERTLLKMCRILNVLYSEISVESTMKQIASHEASGKNVTSVFGLYKSKLAAETRGFETTDGILDLRFVEPEKDVLERTIENTVEDLEQLKDFWGGGLRDDQYDYLESQLDFYRRTHKADTAAEVSLLRQICFAEMDIREARESSKKSSDSAIKRLQELMKNAGVDPAKASIASAGKSQDAFSSFVKIIEENEPAEYYEDKDLFKDHDNIDWYFKKYVTRPLKNFITGSRDFDITTEDDDDEMDDFEGISTEISEEDLF